MHIDPRTAPVVARVRGLSDVRAEWAGVRQLEAALVKDKEGLILEGLILEGLLTPLGLPAALVQDKETQQLAGLVPLEGLLVLGLLGARLRWLRIRKPSSWQA